MLPDLVTTSKQPWDANSKWTPFPGDILYIIPALTSEHASRNIDIGQAMVITDIRFSVLRETVPDQLPLFATSYFHFTLQAPHYRAKCEAISTGLISDSGETQYVIERVDMDFGVIAVDTTRHHFR